MTNQYEDQIRKGMNHQDEDKNNPQKQINRQYKDRLFKFIFGNPEKKEWTLSLYNAMNGTAYTDANELEFNTIGDAVYMGMKNDVSFLISSEMNLWEQQSSFNPNMPMRMLLYAARLYDKYIQTSDYYIYSSTLQKIPTPVCICFYNGKQNQPEREILRLSDAYAGDGDIEVKVTMLNINYGKNRKLMESCRPLREYAWVVDKVRRNQKKNMNLNTAVDEALNEMPDDFSIKTFLVENKAEVRGMMLTEYNEQKVLAQERKEGVQEGIQKGVQEGIQKGMQEGIQQTAVTVVTTMLKNGYTVPEVIRMTGLPENTVKSIAEKQNKPAMA